jgi:hypothetical protein
VEEFKIIQVGIVVKDLDKALSAYARTLYPGALGHLQV